MIPHSQPWIQKSDLAAFSECVESSMLSYDAISKTLETEMAAYLSKNYALQTGNGTQAQFILLKALGIGPGDEVIIPTYACDKVLKGILATGAKPVLCDVNPYWIMDEQTIYKHVNKKTKAIILVHIFGINAFKEELRNFQIPIIEDVCQSFGGMPKERTGTFTGYAFTSFHGTKMLSSGEGGMVFVNEGEIFEKCVSIQKEFGLLCRGTDLGASILQKQFNRISENLALREQIMKRYLSELPERLIARFKTVKSKSNGYRFLLQTVGEYQLIKNEYEKSDIAVRKGVDSLIHARYESAYQDFPNATNLFNTTISIPILPQLTEADVSRIISATQLIFSRGIL